MRFNSMADLRGFLLHNERGNQLLHRLIEEEMPRFLATAEGEQWIEKIEKAGEHPKVLIVIYGDGYSEVHSSNYVSVEVAKVPMTSWKTMEPEVVERMEEAAKSLLGKVWVKLWNKDKPRAIFNSLPIKPTQFLKRELSRGVIGMLRTIERGMSSTILASGDARSVSAKSASSSTDPKTYSESGTHARSQVQSRSSGTSRRTT